jgi:hypothetical protein
MPNATSYILKASLHTSPSSRTTVFPEVPCGYSMGPKISTASDYADWALVKVPAAVLDINDNALRLVNDITGTGLARGNSYVELYVEGSAYYSDFSIAVEIYARKLEVDDACVLEATLNCVDWVSVLKLTSSQDRLSSVTASAVISADSVAQSSSSSSQPPQQQAGSGLSTTSCDSEGLFLRFRNYGDNNDRCFLKAVSVECSDAAALSSSSSSPMKSSVSVVLSDNSEEADSSGDDGSSSSSSSSSVITGSDLEWWVYAAIIGSVVVVMVVVVVVAGITAARQHAKLSAVAKQGHGQPSTDSACTTNNGDGGGGDIEMTVLDDGVDSGRVDGDGSSSGPDSSSDDDAVEADIRHPNRAWDELSASCPATQLMVAELVGVMDDF